MTKHNEVKIISYQYWFVYTNDDWNEHPVFYEEEFKITINDFIDINS